MNTTRHTLIERVRNQDDSVAWEEFYALYASLILRYTMQRGLNETDASDVVADCMSSLSQQMRHYSYDPQRCKFRSYLRRIVRNKVAEHVRKKRPELTRDGELCHLEDDNQRPDQMWDTQWEISHMMFCWSLVENEVPDVHAEAFRLTAIHGLPPRRVAELLELETNHVYQIKSRMTRRLREVMGRVMDDECWP